MVATVVDDGPGGVVATTVNASARLTDSSIRFSGYGAGTFGVTTFTSRGGSAAVSETVT